MSAKKLLVMAGGTGGHIFPALAVANQLRQQGWEIHWLGSSHGMENKIVPQNDIPLHLIQIRGIRGNGMVRLLAAPFKILKAIVEAWRYIRKIRPNAVLGMGGFVTGPGGVAAKLAGVPLVIHEQNAIAGLTNRWLSKIANCVFQAFPNTFESGNKLETIGNPVRADIMALKGTAERILSRQGPIRLLVVGGSLGAKALNELLPGAIAQIKQTSEIEVMHQTGRGKKEQVLESYQKHGLKVDDDGIVVSEFIDDMPGAYEWADFAICRSGALTVSELASAGMPAILVPYPYAVDDHQTKNAEFLTSANGAQIIQERDLTQSVLTDLIAGLLDREKLSQMAINLEKVAENHATEKVVETLNILAI